MNIKLVRPFKICGVDCQLTLTVSARRQDLDLERLVGATVSDAVMSFTHSVLESVPAPRERPDDSTVAADIQRLRQIAQDKAQGASWSFKQLAGLARENGLFAEIIGGQGVINRQQAATLSLALLRHGRRFLRARNRGHGRRYTFRPCEGHEPDHD